MSGMLTALSHFEMDCLDTFAFSASSSCDQPFFFLSVKIFSERIMPSPSIPAPLGAGVIIPKNAVARKQARLTIRRAAVALFKKREKNRAGARNLVSRRQTRA